MRDFIETNLMKLQEKAVSTLEVVRHKICVAMMRVIVKISPDTKAGLIMTGETLKILGKVN